ncbi:lysophospholipid acyltransferase family protein [Actinocorallia aurea]
MAAALPPVPRHTAALRGARLAGVLARAVPSGPGDLVPLSRALLTALDITVTTEPPGEDAARPARRLHAVRGNAQGPALSVPGPTGTLIVANHVSWLDIPALLSLEPVTMLAKREVGTWPLIGGLARRAGTCFIDRDRLHSLPGTVADIAALLRAGTSVVAFPEGTTRCLTPGHLHRAVFQAALDAAAPIRPVTLTYRQGPHPSTLPAYVGTDPFTLSLRRVLTATTLSLSLHLHPPLHPSPSDTRRSLAAHIASLLAPAVPAPAHQLSPA